MVWLFLAFLALIVAACGVWSDDALAKVVGGVFLLTIILVQLPKVSHPGNLSFLYAFSIGAWAIALTFVNGARLRQSACKLFIIRGFIAMVVLCYAYARWAMVSYEFGNFVFAFVVMELATVSALLIAGWSAANAIIADIFGGKRGGSDRDTLRGVGSNRVMDNFVADRKMPVEARPR